MARYGLTLWDYWRIIYKRKWIITSIFLVSVASSYLFTEKEVPMYKATVTLYMNTRNTPIAEITGGGVTFWGGGMESMATQLELIKSYNILELVAQRLGYVTSDEDVEKVQLAVNSLRGKITVAEKETANLFEISATDDDPARAKKIVDAVTAVFVQKHWEDKVEEARNTKKFVEKQLAKLEKESSDIKKKLRVLMVENVVGTVPGNAGYVPPEENFASSEMERKTRLMQLELELANLRERFTDKYPRIVNILGEIKNLKKYLGEALEDPCKDGVEGKTIDVESVDPERLRRELEINNKIYAFLKERYERALLLEASKVSDIEIVDPATLPTTPSNAPSTANFMLSGAIGLILGLVAAFVVESLDTSIGTIEDVEEYLGIPVLGVVPEITVDRKEEADYWKKAPPPNEKKEYEKIMGRLVTQYRPKSSVAEAYRNLQTYIKFSGLDKVGNCLMFSSAGVQEGKTITSVNCALSMAQLGYKVLLVDADLRRPSVHKVFGISREVGMTDVVFGTFKMEDAVKTMDDIMMGNIKASVIMKTYGMENLHVMTSGHMPTNPTEIFGSKNMTEFIKEAKSKFQVVFFDSAPILPVTDSCILGSRVDGVIIVYKAGFVSRSALRRCKMQIENAKGKPIGVVLNNIRVSDMKFGSPFYYYYESYYGEDEKKDTGKETKEGFLSRLWPWKQ